LKFFALVEAVAVATIKAEAVVLVELYIQAMYQSLQDKYTILELVKQALDHQVHQHLVQVEVTPHSASRVVEATIQELLPLVVAEVAH
jgi:cytosine/adenosine deaminase-related metal-dependent hydrolase